MESNTARVVIPERKEEKVEKASTEQVERREPATKEKPFVVKVMSYIPF